eukprot:scaffold8.g1485.t1
MGAPCRPGAVQWIESVFSDCGRDLLGFSVGLASIACWLCAQAPQLYRNYRSKSVEALSAWFLAEWLLGDTFNLVGSLLKGDQPQSVVLTAQYFVLMDMVLLTQYLFYREQQRRRERIAARRFRRHRHHHHHTHVSGMGSGHLHHHASQQQQQQQQQEGEPPPELTEVGGVPALADSGGGGGGGRDVAFRPQRALVPLAAGAVLLSQAPRLQRAGAAAAGPAARRLLAVAMPAGAHAAGAVLGYASSVLYLTSRISQIYKNWERRSVEGLAMSMFFCAIAANLCYGASILIRTYTAAQLLGSLPWLVGSLGTVALDVTILLQSRAFPTGEGSHAHASGGAAAAFKRHQSDEEVPLLPGQH